MAIKVINNSDNSHNSHNPQQLQNSQNNAEPNQSIESIAAPTFTFAHKGDDKLLEKIESMTEIEAMQFSHIFCAYAFFITVVLAVTAKYVYKYYSTVKVYNGLKKLRKQ